MNSFFNRIAPALFAGLVLHLLVLSGTVSYAQGEMNVWTFGDHTGLNFNPASPAPYANNLNPGYEGTASISNASGQLLFYTNGFWVWNRDHQLMPELTGGISGYTNPIVPTVGYPPLMPFIGGYVTQPAAICGVPAHSGLYYIFSLNTDGQLYYSMIDMSLNAGKGGIVSGKKGIYLASGLAEKMTVVKGCNNIWLMVRSLTSNQYKAFEVNDTGIVASPVVSNVGLMPVSWYRCGVIKCSPDGRRMAAACNEATNNKGGLELYDFDAKTGVLSNPLVLDSSSTLGYYYGACFSPDNTKLYGSTSSFNYGGNFYYGKVRQFDLSLSTPTAIIASNTLVFTDWTTATNNIGDLQRGVNGRIYFGSGKPAPFATSYIPSMHCISLPNLAGLACGVTPNAVSLPVGAWTYRGLPNDIAIIPTPDSVHSTKQVTVCFKDSAFIVADSGKRYVWQNGSTNRRLRVSANGTYVVSYVNMDCKYEMDSFKVRFFRLPVIGGNGYSCPNANQGIAWIKQPASDTTTFHYSWRDGSGNVLQQRFSNSGDTVKGLDTGLHYVQVTTPSGCDTTLAVRISPLPVPLASFTVDNATCVDSPVSFANTSAAPISTWYFGDGNYSGQRNAQYTYRNKGLYTVSLVATNIEGCSDTARQDITVRGLDLSLIADKVLVNKGELMHLQSSGSEPYTAIAWEPAFLCHDQSALVQSVVMDTTRTFIMTGVSSYGCVAKASVEVAVNPIVFMPTAFTPNGDGINDRFRPVSTGYIFVQHFEVYNRYGQKVYMGYGKQALEGWNGTYNDKLLDLGCTIIRSISKPRKAISSI